MHSDVVIIQEGYVAHTIILNPFPVRSIGCIYSHGTFYLELDLCLLFGRSYSPPSATATVISKACKSTDLLRPRWSSVYASPCMGIVTVNSFGLLL